MMWTWQGTLFCCGATAQSAAKGSVPKYIFVTLPNSEMGGYWDCEKEDWGGQPL